MANDAIYARQQSLGLQGSELTVCVIGCGGVGCWVALALAMGGIRELLLFDGDSLSEHNLNRLPFPLASVGQLKSEALANWLQSLRPDLEIQARGAWDRRLHARCYKSTANEYINWVVCATDSLKSRQAVYSWVREDVGCHYLELGADGERWTMGAEPPQFSTALENEPGYAIVPVHVGPCMMAGAAAAYYVLHNCEVPGDHLGEWLTNGEPERLNIQAYMPATVDDQRLLADVARVTELGNLAGERD